MEALFKTIVLLLVFLAALIPLGQLPSVNSETSTIADQTLAYIENVLPIDTTAYNITLTDLEDSYASYSLTLGETEFEVACSFENGKIIHCDIFPYGFNSIVSDRQYVDVFDVVRQILRRQQVYSGLDSTEMIGVLRMINPESGEWSQTSNNNVHLEITHYNVPTTWVDAIRFSFGQQINSTLVSPIFTVQFTNGGLSEISDRRLRSYVYDNANVSVTEEQAFSIALSSVENYSYVASDGTTVNGFTTSKEQATAYQLATVKSKNQLHPCWTVVLNLTQTYPDNVTQLFVNLWADTGEVFAMGNLAETRYQNNSNPTPTPESTSTVEPSPSQSPPPSAEPTTSPTQNQPIPPEALYTIAIVAVIIAVGAVAIFLRKWPSKQKPTQLAGAST